MPRYPATHDWGRRFPYVEWVQVANILCVSKSTLAAEMVAMAATLRVLAFPIVMILDGVFGPTHMQISGDNQSMLRNTRTSRSPTTRHSARTDRVPVAGLCEVYHRGNFGFMHVRVGSTAVDISTKTTPSPPKWIPARRLICVFSDDGEALDHLSGQQQQDIAHATP